ncbi:MAG: lytic transglycosylase domain-containing protein [Deltaproteobacteria bacterium]
MNKAILILTYLLLLLSCSSLNENNRNNSSTLTPEETRQDPNFPLAEAFDALLRGLPNSKDFTPVTSKECRQSPSAPLCACLKKIKTFKTIREQKSSVYTPNLTKPLVPMIPVFAHNKVTNWGQLRKAPLANLLKGFLATDKNQLLMIANRSLEEKQCPNHAAVAAAATLEDYLPNDISISLLAQLYEKGGTCKKIPAADRENFLTRSGLFYFMSKNFIKSEAVLSLVSPTDAYSGRASYWLYRTKKELQDAPGSLAALNRLSNQHKFSFHHLVASHQENREPVPEFTRSLTFHQRSSKYPSLNPLIEGAEILSRLNFFESAHLIVDWLLTQPKVLEAEVRIYLSQLGDPHAKVIQMPGILMFHPKLLSKETLTLNFPQAFLPLFNKHRRSVSAYLLMAIARRESSFNPRAVSPANAQGLLQMNPETVKTLFPDKSFDLLDPETNISIASHYLAKVLDEMKGNLPATLAAYNAGEAQVVNWEKRYPTADRILWIDLIPYRETRDYVANVLNSYHWYRKIYENNSDFGDLFP